MTGSLNIPIRRLLAVAGWVLLSTLPTHAAEVVTLTQTPCQFIEPEGGDRHFVSTRKADCVAENKASGADRVSKSHVITLTPGDYIFRVTNQTVPYSLGFWLREADYDWKNPLHKLTKISISGGGLATGVTRDYEVTLEPGEYLYSCPLNTTPDYKLVVTN